MIFVFVSWQVKGKMSHCLVPFSFSCMAQIVALDQSEKGIQVSITVTRYVIYMVIFHGCKNNNFQMKHCDIFLIFAQNVG